MPRISLPSPIGSLIVTEKGGCIVAVDWGEEVEAESSALLNEARQQLGEYFAGERTEFQLALDPLGTAFQQRVWAAMQAIPIGQTQSYGEMARALGTAPRALGGACGRNPIPIIIPCHRVLGSNGSLGGYSGMNGVETKRWLLELEARTLKSSKNKSTDIK